MGDGSSEWAMALDVLCQGALVGGVIGALGAVNHVQVILISLQIGIRKSLIGCALE